MKVTLIPIDEEAAGQRIDNFLVTYLKGVPKSRVYRGIRTGEVRVNKSRVKAEYRLKNGDFIRIPPIRVPEPKEPIKPSQQLSDLLESRILYEDPVLIIINKPSGMPVHGGSGIHIGLIEGLRVIRPKQRLLELVHRLDRETSGCLIIAKKRSFLIEAHGLLKRRKVIKQYLTLVKGRWPSNIQQVAQPLQKNILQSGERMVKVDEQGKPALTTFRILKTFSNATLLEARPVTGRTHQIRLHTACMGHPIAGDQKYGDVEFNKHARQLGLKRLFLHSAGIQFKLSERNVGVCALLDEDLLTYLRQL